MEVNQNELLDAHLTFIHNIYNDDVAMNIGWASGEDFIQTKIYGDEKYNPAVVHTEVTRDGRFIHDSWKR